MRSRLPIQLFTVAALSSAAAAQTIDAFGLHNTPRGSAGLAYDPAARRLVVTNIGSSGQDGVSFEGGFQYAVYFGSESLDASTPDGGGIETQIRLNGLPPGTRYIGNRVTHTGPTWTITGTALGIGAGGFYYLVLDHGQATGRVFVQNGGDAVASAAPIGGSAGPTFSADSDPGPAGTGCDPWETLQWTCTSANGTTCGVSWGNSPSAALTACCSGSGGTLVSKCAIQSFAGFRFHDATTFTIGPVTCAGDTLLLVADVTGDAHSIATVDVIGKDLAPAGTPGSFTLSSEEIEFDDYLVASLGDAQIHAELDATGARRLPVNNIGSSGQDGVEINLRGCKQATVDVTGTPGGVPIGHIALRKLGIRDGVDGLPIGSLEYRQSQGFFDVFADFSDIGSPTHHVVLLSQGAVVLDLPGQTGQVCTTSDLPTQMGMLDLPDENFVVRAPVGTQFTVQGALYLADEMRVLAEGATIPVSAVTRARLYGRDVLLLCRGIHTDGTELPTGQAYCSGDGTGTPCPCGNSGAPGRGCANSVNAAGALLESHGIARLSADSLVLTGSGMPNGTTLYFQGNATVNGGLGNPFGDGLRCAGTNVRRLGTKQNVLGTSSYPGGGDLPISVQGQVLAPGGRRYYQAWYRNAASFCTASTFNLSNGMWNDWGP